MIRFQWHFFINPYKLLFLLSNESKLVYDLRLLKNKRDFNKSGIRDPGTKNWGISNYKIFILVAPTGLAGAPVRQLVCKFTQNSGMYVL